MRIARVAGLVLLLASLAPTPGCFVFDELDNGNQILDEIGPGATSERAPRNNRPAPPPPRTAAAKPDPDSVPVWKRWWQSASTLGSEESQADIARCVLGFKVEYTLRDDCLARGGRVEP